MNKRILIHVGPPKSGTSAIQLALLQHRDTLSQMGINYPTHGLGANGISSGNLEAILSLDCNNKWQVCEDKISSLIAEFNNSTQHTLLLSSEYFFYLAKEIAVLIPQAKFIAYVRCPIDTYESSYNQSIKRHMNCGPAEFSKNLHTTTLNILSEAVEVIGSKKFILRAYLPFSEDGFDILKDFCTVLDISNLQVTKYSTNSSYAFEALEFKRWINQFSLLNLDTLLDEVLQEYSRGKEHFSLLPPTLFENYQKQALTSIRDFVNSNRVYNAKELIAYIQKRTSLPHKSQLISDTEFEKICEFLKNSHPVIFKEIGIALNKVQNTCSLQAPHRIKIFLTKYQLKRGFISKLGTALNSIKKVSFYT